MVELGAPQTALARIRSFAPTDWEEFVEEWAFSLKADYQDVHRCGGSGDQGRDVICYVANSSEREAWDNYQCKHYPKPLVPTDVWGELGKLCYYTFIGAYTKPRAYYFVAPFDVGTTLAKCLRRPGELRDGLVKNWSRYCAKKIVGGESIDLSGNLRKHVTEYDFATISFRPTLAIVEQHRRTEWHVLRFGGGLPLRESSPLPDDDLRDEETRYVSQLLDAYSENTKTRLVTPSQLGAHPKLARHFKRARESFYSAEALRNFSRDNLPVGEYESLQDQVFDGVADIHDAAHSDGFARVLAVCSQAGALQLTHPLRTRLVTKDRTGICHQLANDERLSWVQSD